MRVLARATAVGLLVSLALAAPAAAELAPRIASPPFRALAGPVFAGDGFVWGRQTKAGYELVAMRDGARTTTKISLPDVPGAVSRRLYGEVEASDRRVVLSLVESACFNRVQCETQPSDTVYRALFTGPVGGDVETVSACASRDDCATDTCPAGGADVSEDAIAYSDCHGVHVRDFAPSASPAARDYPGRTGPRIAGSYVAASIAEGVVSVSNWRTGLDAYDQSEVRHYDVQADGKLAYVRGDDVVWASPLEPTPHVVNTYIGPYDVRMAADRIGAIIDDPPEDQYDYSYRGYQFDVFALDDQPDPSVYTPRFLDEQALFGMDFDGTRLLWADRACRHAWLIAVDPDTHKTLGDAPVTCPLPTIVRRAARFDAGHALRVKLACDVPPGPACVGFARRVGTHGKPLTPVRYSIAERHTKTLELPRNGSLCRAGRHRARAKVMIGSDRVHTVSARGPTAGLPRCS